MGRGGLFKTIYDYGSEAVDSISNVFTGSYDDRYDDFYSNSTNYTSTSFWSDPVDSAYEYLMEYTPDTLKRLISTSKVEGSNLFYDIKSDIQENVINETKVHVDELRELGYDVYFQIGDIFDDIVRIVTSGPASKEVIEKEQKQLKVLEDRFKEIENEVAQSTVEGGEVEVEVICYQGDKTIFGGRIHCH